MKLFRAARHASPARQLAKTLLQTAVFWTVFLFVVPAGIVAAEAALDVASPLPPSPWIGGILFALAGSLGLCSGITMALVGDGTPLPLDTARRLVVRGPYRWVRNPMAIAGITQGVAVGLYRGSLGVVVYAVVGALLWHVAVRPAEERDLLVRFGTDYADYRAAVRCWWPRWPGRS